MVKKRMSAMEKKHAALRLLLEGYTEVTMSKIMRCSVRQVQRLKQESRIYLKEKWEEENDLHIAWHKANRLQLLAEAWDLYHAADLRGKPSMIDRILRIQDSLSNVCGITGEVQYMSKDLTPEEKAQIIADYINTMPSELRNAAIAHINRKPEDSGSVTENNESGIVDKYKHRLERMALPSSIHKRSVGKDTDKPEK